jgi:hypothetical protein
VATVKRYGKAQSRSVIDAVGTLTFLSENVEHHHVSGAFII